MARVGPTSQPRHGRHDDGKRGHLSSRRPSSAAAAHLGREVARPQPHGPALSRVKPLRARLLAAQRERVDQRRQRARAEVRHAGLWGGRGPRRAGCSGAGASACALAVHTPRSSPGLGCPSCVSAGRRPAPDAASSRHLTDPNPLRVGQGQAGRSQSLAPRGLLARPFPSLSGGHSPRLRVLQQRPQPRGRGLVVQPRQRPHERGHVARLHSAQSRRRGRQRRLHPARRRRHALRREGPQQRGQAGRLRGGSGRDGCGGAQRTPPRL
jgi:hypothetical protein